MKISSNGSISKDEFFKKITAIISTLGEKANPKKLDPTATDSNIDKLFKDLDVDNDREISYREFSKIAVFISLLNYPF